MGQIWSRDTAGTKGGNRASASRKLKPIKHNGERHSERIYGHRHFPWPPHYFSVVSFRICGTTLRAWNGQRCRRHMIVVPGQEQDPRQVLLVLPCIPHACGDIPIAPYGLARSLHRRHKNFWKLLTRVLFLYWDRWIDPHLMIYDRASGIYLEDRTFDAEQRKYFVLLVTLFPE